ncbi:GAF domain-containing sensor histidine kinase [Polyangium sp. 6x1]|uniref:GAF domain-containing sensor histidine kinase n=1 Tax=Polyangium sp. 6x1 TaxID=3042689 RepID=UPI002482586C|nr:GAF domain-containing sensor histidine kinase [Polyangium sp. 6x1]MDI1451927.1 GAF domain-containing sensor histidine kinase [Polyangium sp. 6x1]
MQGQPVQALLLRTLERLFEIPSADLPTALALACDAIAEAIHADKVDAFLLEPTKHTLVAIGASNQPLSSLQRKVGLDVLPLANGGRAVQVFETRRPFRSGRLREDPDELKGIRETLKLESVVGVPIELGGEVRGVLMVCSLKRDFFTDDDERFVALISRWVGTVAHRAELVEEIGRNAVEQGRRAVAEELVTVLAHDLRNFLSPISARLQLLWRRAQQDERAADVRDSQAALHGVERLSRLISDILDVARLDQGVFRLDLQPVDLGSLCSEIARTLSTPTHEVVVAASEEVIVDADPSRVSQCLENLVSNAIRHSPRDAPVVMIVGTKSLDQGGVGSVEVVDEGPGVPVELLPRIFDRFYAGKSSTGLGIGLYLARRIAMAHGGALSVESSPGKGARFRLQLPLHRDD